jgi:hypothetical protein
LYLPLSLRGVVLVATKKGRGIGEVLEQEKKHSYSQYDSFMGIGRGVGELLESISSGRRKL